MKRILKTAALSGLIFLTFTAARAQQKLQMKIGYNISVPVGSFTNFIDNTSLRGVNGEITYPVCDQFSIGVGASFSDYYKKNPRQVYQTKDGDISAVVTNSIQTTPVFAKANYSFLKEGLVLPYVGLGAGFNFISYNQYLGEFPNSKTSIKPAVTGDAGVNIPLGKTKTAGINLGANYNYLPFNYNEVKNLNNWGVHAGLFFALH